MNGSKLEHSLDRHEAFLECRTVDRPLIGPWVSGYYPAEQFPRGTARWRSGEVMHPDEVSFVVFAEDYECLYQLHRRCGGDFGYVGSPYWGIPWLEAIMGCPVTAATANCCARPYLTSLDGAEKLSLDLDTNPWLNVLLQFTRELIDFSAGRFPVCPPLLRGPGDTAAALLGEMAYVTGFYDSPEKIRGLLEKCAAVRLAVLERLHAAIPSWRGVHVAGGYPSMVWSRRTVAYHQEDSAAVLNPSLFREFVLPALRTGCDEAEINFIHLHSACLYPIEILLEDDMFDVLEVNIDHRGMGPPVAKLIDSFKRIQGAGRPLVLWGEFDPGEWELIQAQLSPAGLSLQPISRQAATRKWCV